MSVCLVCNTAVGAGKRKYLDVSTEPLLSIRELLVRSQDEEDDVAMHQTAQVNKCNIKFSQTL